MIDTTPTESNLSGLDKKAFQKNINNQQTDLYILKNAQGMEVAVTNYGCALLSIMVPDKNGKYANVVLGHDSIEHVINSPEPFLSTTGLPMENLLYTAKNINWPSTTVPIHCMVGRPAFTPVYGMRFSPMSRPSFSTTHLPTAKRASPAIWK